MAMAFEASSSAACARRSALLTSRSALRSWSFVRAVVRRSSIRRFISAHPERTFSLASAAEVSIFCPVASMSECSWSRRRPSSD